jgi:hypothetical protein
VRLDRRSFLHLLGATLAALAAPAALARHALARARGRFFTAAERAALEALCDAILPPDHDPGAAELGAPDYIERLLLSVDAKRPFVFARGPFSGRAPFASRDGTPARRRPRNRFRDAAPLSRLQRLHWNAEILGGSAAGLPPHLLEQRGGALRGLREIYRDGLRTLDEEAAARTGLRFAELLPAERADLVLALDRSGAFPPEPVRGRGFLDLAIRHVLEGCFAPPEYGGNRDGRGWAMLGIEGDSQPLGHSIFSRATQRYHERPDHPVSTANPDELGPDGSLVPRPLGADGAAIQQSIAELTGILEIVPGACQ